jgi:hypothetical protein
MTLDEIRVNIKLLKNKIGFDVSGQQALNNIEEFLNQYKAPTADDVCEALGEFFNCHVDYFEGEERFYTEDHSNLLDWYLFESFYISQIPPHLITMIGRFYEGLRTK